MQFIQNYNCTIMKINVLWIMIQNLIYFASKQNDFILYYYADLTLFCQKL